MSLIPWLKTNHFTAQQLWGVHPIASYPVDPFILQAMEANSSNKDERIQPDALLIPEETLQSFLGTIRTDLSLEASQVANANGWTASLMADRQGLFERKVS